MSRKRARAGALEPDEVLPPEGETITVTTEKRITRAPNRDEDEERDERPTGPSLEFDEEDEDEEIEEESIDTYLDNFFEKLDGSTSATVTVLRLPDGYQYAGVFTIPAPGPITCDPVRVQAGMAAEDMYGLVRRMNGSGGHYKFQLRAGRGFGRAWEKTLSNPAPAQQQEQHPAQPAQPAEGEMERALKWAQMLGEMMRNLGGGRGRAEAPPQPPQLAAAEAVSPVAQLNDAIQLVNAVKGLAGDLSPAPAPSGGGLLAGAAQLVSALGLKDIVPQLLQLAIVSQMQKSPGALQPGYAPPPAPSGAPAAPGQNVVPFPGVPAAPAEPAAEEKDPQTVIEDALEDMRLGNPVDAAAADIVAMLRHPEHGTYASAVMTMPPGEILLMLFQGDPEGAAKAADEKNVAWVARLQAKAHELEAAAVAAGVRP